jgi:hypothetical protein
MYYAALLVFVALAVFFITPSLKKSGDSPAPLDLLFREVQYKLGLPKGTQPAGTRYTPPKRKPPEKTQPTGSRVEDNVVTNPENKEDNSSNLE